MRDQGTRPESIPRYDTRHPEYEDWLRETNIKREDTGTLVLALVRSPAREAMFERWHQELCNAVPTYTNEIGEEILRAVAAELEDRIDGGGRRR